jgi:hypothetical protein|tara:strand:+ start:246 stop:563 length:318 start_codon:yes stop_codon:yes gene_type:complete
MPSKDAKYAYIRVENGLYPAIVTELGYESERPPRGLRVKSGKTLAELAQLAQSKSKSSEAKIARQFFDLWSVKTKKALGPVSREDKIKALFDSLSDEEKARILGI